jgi:peptide/nickel transport system permease protein
MRGFLTARLIAAPLLILGILTLAFILVHTAPGEPFSAERTAGLSPDAAARLRAIFGADDPLPIRYARWLGAAARLDFGVSFTHRRPALSVLADALVPTLLLMGTSLIAALGAGMAAACAVAAARRPGLDRALELAALTAYSAPSFWIGVLLVRGVAVGLGWLPASGWRTPDHADAGLGASVADIAAHLMLPCITLAAPAAAGIALHLKSGLETSLAAPSAQAARGRGCSWLRVSLSHGRNASASLVTLLGFMLPGLVGGSLVVEVLFAWPGMGRVAYEAILARDLPVIMAAVLLAAVLTLAGSIAADIGLALLDPRVRLAPRKASVAAAP